MRRADDIATAIWVVEGAPWRLHSQAVASAGVDENRVRADGTHFSPRRAARGLFTRNGVGGGRPPELFERQGTARTRLEISGGRRNVATDHRTGARAPNPTDRPAGKIGAHGGHSRQQ